MHTPIELQRLKALTALRILDTRRKPFSII